MKIVTLTDTGESLRLLTEIPVAPHPSPSGEGWGWIDATDYDGSFQVVGLWGRDGWDLGCWPYIVFAFAQHPTEAGSSAYGYATYVEGDLAAHWYSTEEARNLAVSKEAWWYWCSGQSDGPEALRGLDPDDFRAIDGLCEPFEGFGC